MLVYCTFFFRPSFVPFGFTDKVFNATILTNFLEFQFKEGVIRKCVDKTQFTKSVLVTFIE